MKSYFAFLLISFKFIGIANAAPAVITPDSALRLVDAASDDIASIAVAKAAALGFIGGVAAHSVRNVIPNVTHIYKSVADGTDVALKTTYEAGENTWKYVKDVSTDTANSLGENVNAIRNTDPIQVINDTESAILTKNEVVLKALFDAKRKAFLALQDFSENTANFTSSAWSTTNQNAQLLLNSTASQWETMNVGLQNFWTNTLENLNSALNSAQSTLQASKETLADVYNNITLANAQHVANITLVNVQNTATGVGNTISAGVDTTITITGNVTSAAIDSLVEAKSGIHEAAENFDSKSVIKNTKKQIGNAIVSTMEGAGNLLEQAGVYDAIDGIVHGFAGMPVKMDNMVEQTREAIGNSPSVAIRLVWSDDEPKNEEVLGRTKSQTSNVEGQIKFEYEDNNKGVDDDIDYEIQSIEDDVKEIEKYDYQEDTENEEKNNPKTSEVFQLMETFDTENNEIVR